MPMTRDRQVLQAAHEKAAELVIGCLKEGKDVAFLNLGDVTIYASYLYVHRLVLQKGFQAELVNGIPSFCAAAARLGIGLAENSDQMHILSQPGQIEEGLKPVSYTHLVQTTHVISGFEYDRMMAAVDSYREYFRKVSCGRPLLTSKQDYRDVVLALGEELSAFRRPGTDIVLMGHGTEHAANEAYGRLQQEFTEAGLEDFLVGTVEASPTLENMVRLVETRGAEYVVLAPFMVVAGDHACNDMAGDDEDSWKSKFLRDGYQAECVMKGLGEYASIRRIYVEHAGCAVGALG